jgi:hypothetical protein
MEKKVAMLVDLFQAAGWGESGGMVIGGVNNAYAIHYASGMSVLLIPTADYAGSPSGVLEGTIQGEFEFEIPLEELPAHPTPRVVWEIARKALADSYGGEDLVGDFVEGK